MTARGFIETSERYGQTYREVAQIVCSQCKTICNIAIKSTDRRYLPPTEQEKKFVQKGWSIGATPRDDLCPDCKTKMRKTVLKVVSNAAAELDAKPREMSVSDRRIIFAKLDEVYLDEKRGYDAGWSDHKVATDLGVPRKWVETIRAENFGPIGTNEDMASFLSEAEVLLADARKALAEAKEAREAVEKILRHPAFLSLPDISNRLGKVEKLAGEVRKLVVVA